LRLSPAERFKDQQDQRKIEAEAIELFKPGKTDPANSF
jgi:hypothetical protein